MRDELFVLGLSAALSVNAAACGSKSSGSSSGDPAKTSATAKPKPKATATEPPEEPRPTSPFELQGDPFSEGPQSPGQLVEIPRAKGYSVVVPKGWKVDKDAANSQSVLVPPSGTAKVVIAAEGTEAALDLRVSKFLQESLTREETWQPEKETRIGAAGIAGKYALGVGYQGFPGGRREPHKVLRVRVPTDIPEGTGTLVIQALAVWNGADVETEVAIVELVRGVQRK